MAKATLEELLRSGNPVVGPGIYDCLSARLAERAGFPMAFLSGYCLSASLLGKPDFGLLTQTQLLDAADRICAAVDIPVIVDIDTGYGNAFNVEQTIEALLRRGAAGCFLEDQVFPKRCGHMERKRVVELDEYLPKLRAAIAARGDAPFHITARTDARAVHGLSEAIRRAQAFAEAGADAVFVEAPQSVDELREIAQALSGTTLVANMVEQGKTPLLNVEQLAALGFRLIAFPVSGVLASACALRDVFAALAAAGTTRGQDARLLRFEELNRLVGLDEHYARERVWLDR